MSRTSDLTEMENSKLFDQLLPKENNKNKIQFFIAQEIIFDLVNKIILEKTSEKKMKKLTNQILNFSKKYRNNGLAHFLNTQEMEIKFISKDFNLKEKEPKIIKIDNWSRMNILIKNKINKLKKKNSIRKNSLDKKYYENLIHLLNKKSSTKNSSIIIEKTYLEINLDNKNRKNDNFENILREKKKKEKIKKNKKKNILNSEEEIEEEKKLRTTFRIIHRKKNYDILGNEIKLKKKKKRLKKVFPIFSARVNSSYKTDITKKLLFPQTRKHLTIKSKIEITKLNLKNFLKNKKISSFFNNLKKIKPNEGVKIIKDGYIKNEKKFKKSFLKNNILKITRGEYNNLSLTQKNFNRDNFELKKRVSPNYKSSNVFNLSNDYWNLKKKNNINKEKNNSESNSYRESEKFNIFYSYSNKKENENFGKKSERKQCNHFYSKIKENDNFENCKNTTPKNFIYFQNNSNVLNKNDLKYNSNKKENRFSKEKKKNSKRKENLNLIKIRKVVDYKNKIPVGKNFLKYHKKFSRKKRKEINAINSEDLDEILETNYNKPFLLQNKKKYFEPLKKIDDFNLRIINKDKSRNSKKQFYYQTKKLHIKQNFYKYDNKSLNRGSRSSGVKKFVERTFF